MSDKVYVGLPGFASDAQTVLNKVLFSKGLYELREKRKLRPQVAANMISNLLYKHRFGGFFTTPLVAGLDPVTHKPYLGGMDTIGCIASPRDFVAVGCGAEYCLGVCEGEWGDGGMGGKCKIGGGNGGRGK